ncbi:MAG: YIP1 family protein [Aphanothece saxicola GSE-SYN-MK-01-06B]|jgi:hypothetical protein|nr:YIP1 family protein [Aphanothece saxicola GSE-SYN-MK-01-06B]
MKELLELIWHEFFVYLPILTGIIQSPVRTMLSLLEDRQDRLNRAFSFYGITLAIGLAFQAPLLLKGQDFVSVAGSLLILRTIAILTFAGIIQIIFKWLGGKGDYESTLCACLYIVSPVYLFLVLWHILGVGILATHSAQLATAWRLGNVIPKVDLELLLKSSPILATGFFLAMVVRFVVSVLWFLICWKIYRHIHKVTKARSAVAYLVSMVLWFLYWNLIALIMKGLYGGSLSPIG